MPLNTMSVARPSKWGNIVKVGAEMTVEAVDGNRHTFVVSPAIAVAIYRQSILSHLAKWPDLLESLRGKNLACWCALEEPCHADVLLDLANR